jgi:sulfonate transport system ATP-binding protein
MASELSAERREVTARKPFPPQHHEAAGYAVEVRAVEKRFPHTGRSRLPRDEGAAANRIALRGVDLRIEAGEFIAIVGRSGCGKSTLLRLIAGLDTPSAGTVVVGDRPVGGVTAGTRMMFQDARLLPWKRVAENVLLGLPAGVDARGAVQAALQHVGLAGRARDWPAVLSGGQRQRVALARALASAPHLLLLDEPLGALDALTRREMQDLIERLWTENRFTAILVTHDVEEAVALADRVIVLNEGRAVLELPIDLPHPRPRATAAFAELSERLLRAILDPTAGEAEPGCGIGARGGYAGESGPYVVTDGSAALPDTPTRTRSAPRDRL